MANSCCAVIDVTNVLQNEFVANIYTNILQNESLDDVLDNPKCTKHNCLHCHTDRSQYLAITILGILRDDATTLSKANTIRLRAAFSSLKGTFHGVHRLTYFYITKVVELKSGIHARVWTQHGGHFEAEFSTKEFLDMIVDPLEDRSDDLSQIWEETTCYSIGGKTPRGGEVRTTKETPCWCCNTPMYYVSVTSESPTQ